MPKVLPAVVVKTGQLASGALSRRMLDFLDPLAYGRAFELSDWSVESEIMELVRIAKTSQSDRIRIAALYRLHQLAIECLTLSGTIQKLTATKTGPDGTIYQVQAARVQDALVESHDGIARFLLNQRENPNDGDENESALGIHKPPAPPPEDSGSEDSDPDGLPEPEDCDGGNIRHGDKGGVLAAAGLVDGDAAVSGNDVGPAVSPVNTADRPRLRPGGEDTGSAVGLPGRPGNAETTD